MAGFPSTSTTLNTFFTSWFFASGGAPFSSGARRLSQPAKSLPLKSGTAFPAEREAASHPTNIAITTTRLTSTSVGREIVMITSDHGDGRVPAANGAYGAE